MIFFLTGKILFLIKLGFLFGLLVAVLQFGLKVFPH